MAIRIIDEYPGQVGAPDVDYPEGVPRNVTSPGGGDGTPWEEAFLKDIQGLMQGLLAQVPAGPIVPSGVPDTVLISQYIDAMKLIVQGLDITTFDNAELDTDLRLAPDGTGNTQWLLNVAEQLATAILNVDLVLKPDGLGGVVFGSVPIAGGGGLKSTQVFEADGTWNRPAGINLIKVITLGAGGGGGGATTTEDGASGSAGAYSEISIDVSAIPSVALLVGSGGSGGVGFNDGADGGTSSFGTHTSCQGGFGGVSEDDGLAVTTGIPGAPVPSLGDIKSGGGAGSDSSSSGPGGASFFGGGGLGGFGIDGSNGLALGSGGGSARNSAVGNKTGGDGADGIIIVEEYS